MNLEQANKVMNDLKKSSHWTYDIYVTFDDMVGYNVVITGDNDNLSEEERLHQYIEATKKGDK